MHRFFGLVLIVVGFVGGWLAGRPPAQEPIPELPPGAAWRQYRAEFEAAQQFQYDIPLHPAWVALMVATASFGTMIVTWRWDDLDNR
jgi:hypothetical protein